jgi:copper chaperone
VKRIIFPLTLALFLAWLPYSHAATDETALSVPLQVDGMTCTGCVVSVTRALKAVPGVSTVKVSLEKNEAVVAYDKDRTTVERLIHALEKAGYKASAKR